MTLTLVQRVIRLIRENKSASIVCGVLLLVVIILFVVAQVVTMHARNTKTPTDISRITPSQGSFESIDGKPFVLTDSHTDFLVVTSWASWCPQCVEHLTALARLKSERGSTIDVVAINRKEDKNVAVSYLKSMSLPNTIRYVFDPEDIFFMRIGGFAMPETVIYDKNGQLVAHERQPLTYDALQTLITSLQKK